MGGLVNRAKKIRKGKYLYRGYEITRIGYYPPDQKTVWEAVDPQTNCGEFHGFSLREVKYWIDEYEDGKSD